MPVRNPLGKKEEGKVPSEADSTGAKKRSAHNTDGAFDDDDKGASRDAKRRHQPELESLWPMKTAPKQGGIRPGPAKAAPTHLTSRADVLNTSASLPRLLLPRPPKGTPLAPSASGASGGSQGASGDSQTASGGPRGLFSAPSKSPRKHQTLNGLSSSAKNLINASSANPKLDRLSSNSQEPPEMTVSPVRYSFKPANRTAGVLDDKSSSGDDDDEDERYPLDTPKDDEGIEFYHSSEESSEDSESEFNIKIEDDEDDGVNPSKGFPAERSGDSAQSSFQEISETPSGKPYDMLKNEHGVLERVNGALFPDGYQLQHLPDFPGYQFICPVRDCRKLFTASVRLVGHFSAAHPRCHFIDNLDKDGTLTIQKKAASGRSMVVSQWPLDSTVPALKSPSLPELQKRPDSHKIARVETFEDIQNSIDAEYSPPSHTRPSNKVPPTHHQAERSSPANARAAQSPENTSVGHFAVDPAGIKSTVWTCIQPFVGKRWLESFQSDHERTAFLQAIKLPKRNNVDKAWLEGNRKSHQKVFRSLMSIVIHVVGVGATCNVCEKRREDRKRNCMVLPPEAKNMRELQEVVGRQCVNCFFFLPSSYRCEFAITGTSAVDTSNGVRQTPIPVPTPPPTLATLLASRSSSHNAAGLQRPALAPLVSKSPIPVPVLPLRRLAPNSQDPQARLSAEESDGGAARRAGLRSAKQPDVEIDGRGDSVGETGGTDSGHALPDEVTSTDELAIAAATTVSSRSAPSAPLVASAVVSRAFTLFGDITQLPAHEQRKIYDKMAAMLDIASGASSTRGPALTRRAAAAALNRDNISYQSKEVATADKWEIAPGRLVSGGEPVAFSTSSLRREVVSLNSAQYIAPAEKVLNKHITGLEHLRIRPEADWECKFSVTKGLVKVKMGGEEARIGYGGVWLVKRECIVTNILHDESHIQVWWKQADE